MQRIRLGLLVGIGVLCLTACGQSAPAGASAASRTITSSGSTTSSSCVPGPGITQTVTTSSYLQVLDVGPPEKMYTPTQVQTQQPTSGEVMVGGGQMSTMGGMGDPPNAHHLEVHICERTTGKVVSNLKPDITLIDDSAGNTIQHVAAVEMQGVTSGAADLHYGNTVSMPPAHRYTVKVTAGGQLATFHIATPKT